MQRLYKEKEAKAQTFNSLLQDKDLLNQINEEFTKALNYNHDRVNKRDAKVWDLEVKGHTLRLKFFAISLSCLQPSQCIIAHCYRYGASLERLRTFSLVNLQIDLGFPNLESLKLNPVYWQQLNKIMTDLMLDTFLAQQFLVPLT